MDFELIFVGGGVLGNGMHLERTNLEFEAVQFVSNSAFEQNGKDEKYAEM